MLSLAFVECARHGPSVNICFIFPKSSSGSVPYFHVSFFWCFRSRSILSEGFGMNFAMYWIAPTNDFSSVLLYFPVGSVLGDSTFFDRFYSVLFGSCLVQKLCLVLAKFGFSFTCSVSGFLQFIQNVQKIFLVFLFVSRVTTIMASSQAGVPYPSVRSIFS